MIWIFKTLTPDSFTKSATGSIDTSALIMMKPKCFENFIKPLISKSYSLTINPTHTSSLYTSMPIGISANPNTSGE